MKKGLPEASQCKIKIQKDITCTYTFLINSTILTWSVWVGFLICLTVHKLCHHGEYPLIVPNYILFSSQNSIDFAGGLNIGFTCAFTAAEYLLDSPTVQSNLQKVKHFTRRCSSDQEGWESKAATSPAKTQSGASWRENQSSIVLRCSCCQALR